MNQFFIDNIAVFAITIIVLLLIAIICVLALYQKEQQVSKRLRDLTKGRRASTMEGIIQECVESVSDMEGKYDMLNDYIQKNVERRIGAALYKTKLVRYDAYEGLGGELSFIWILLDTKNNGYLIHNIYNREGNSTLYARVITDGRSETRLAPEEEKILKQLVAEA